MTAPVDRHRPRGEPRVAGYIVACCALWIAVRYQPVQVNTGPAAPKALDTQRHEELVHNQIEALHDTQELRKLIREMGYRLMPADITQSDLDAFEDRLEALEHGHYPPLTTTKNFEP